MHRYRYAVRQSDGFLSLCIIAGRDKVSWTPQAFYQGLGLAMFGLLSGQSKQADFCIIRSRPAPDPPSINLSRNVRASYQFFGYPSKRPKLTNSLLNQSEAGEKVRSKTLLAPKRVIRLIAVPCSSDHRMPLWPLSNVSNGESYDEDISTEERRTLVSM